MYITSASFFRFLWLLEDSLLDTNGSKRLALKKQLSPPHGFRNRIKAEPANDKVTSG